MRQRGDGRISAFAHQHPHGEFGARFRTRSKGAGRKERVPEYGMRTKMSGGTGGFRRAKFENQIHKLTTNGHDFQVSTTWASNTNLERTETHVHQIQHTQQNSSKITIKNLFFFIVDLGKTFSRL